MAKYLSQLCLMLLVSVLFTIAASGQKASPTAREDLINTTWQIYFKESARDSWSEGEKLTFLLGGKLKVGGQVYPRTSWRLRGNKLIFSYSNDDAGVSGEGEVTIQGNRADGGGQLGMRATPFIIRLARVESRAPSSPSGSTNISTENSWNSFWDAFHIAVQKRDRRTLNGMMSTSFQFSSEEMSPDQAFSFLDAQRGKAWIALNGVVAKGAVPNKSPSSSRLSRIAPPIAAKNPRYDSWRAIFELGKDGRWRWVAFVIGD